jgi:hypothetical protein
MSWTSDPYGLTVDELACRQIALKKASPGVSFARKKNSMEKNKARQKILSMLTWRRWSKGLSILTLPGLFWTFEKQLLNLREGHWAVKKNPIHSTYICSIEIDPAVYRASFAYMPGLDHKSSVTTILTKNMYAAYTVGTRVIPRYHNCNFFAMAKDYDHWFDVAWLDFNGPVTESRMEILKEFYSRNIRRYLIVTALCARYDQGTNITLAEAGSLEKWFEAELPGKVDHCFRYSDGVPMIQYAVGKVD